MPSLSADRRPSWRTRYVVPRCHSEWIVLRQRKSRWDDPGSLLLHQWGSESGSEELRVIWISRSLSKLDYVKSCTYGLGGGTRPQPALMCTLVRRTASSTRAKRTQRLDFSFYTDNGSETSDHKQDTRCKRHNHHTLRTSYWCAATGNHRPLPLGPVWQASTRTHAKQPTKGGTGDGPPASGLGRGGWRDWTTLRHGGNCQIHESLAGCVRAWSWA